MPTLTASYSGFVSGDTVAVVTGSPGLTTTASVSSPVGTYDILPSAGTLSAANYSFNFVNGALIITNVLAPFSGVAFDGYISNGTVFFDANGNGVLDAGEPQAMTDRTGHFTFTNLVVSIDIDPAKGRIVVTNGTDLATGFPLEAPLTAPLGYQVVSPLTTLISELIQQNTNSTPDSAARQVIAAFGLPPEINLSKDDPFQATNASNAAILVKAAAQVHSLTKEISSLLSGWLTNKSQVSGSVIQVLAAEIQTQTNSIHLEKPDVIQRLILQTQSANQLDTSSPTNMSNVTGAATIIAQANQAMNNVLERKGSLTELVKVQVAAEGKVSSDLESVGKGALDVMVAVGIIRTPP